MDGSPPVLGSQAASSPPLDALQPSTIVEESHSTPPVDAPMADGPPRKQKTRHRILRGLSRTSSSTSLSGLRTSRARSSSTPYPRSGASLSCVSLSASSHPFASSSAISANLSIPPGSAGSASASPSSQSISSPTTPFPAFPHSIGRSQSSNAIRKIDLAFVPGAGSSGGTSAVPADMVRAASMPLFPPRPRKTFAQMWNALPHEVKVRTLGFLKPIELVRLSRTNRKFRKVCFDGQLWTSFDASEFYAQISVQSLATILVNAGPFVKNLNLRGCKQMENMEDALLMASACSNVVNATLEGCGMSPENINELLKRNKRLAHLNLAGLSAVHNSTCLTLSAYCAQLEVLNMSWCKNLYAGAACTILEACPKLRDLRLGEIRGFADPTVAQRFFKVNRLERLVLSGCMELTDGCLAIMMHGYNPQRDILTGKPLTPPRTLRYLDLSRCVQITDRALTAVGQCAPHLEGLILSGVKMLTDQGLKPVFATARNLSVLEAEDIPELTDDLLINHIAKAPCAEYNLKHLSLGYCENISDDGVLPVLRACKNLTTVQLDNTSITNETLIAAASIMRLRQPEFCTSGRPPAPYVGLTMEVYDCHNITWAGVREVMSRNTEALTPPTGNCETHSPQIIALKCFYAWQMTANEHVKRVLQGKLEAARRLEQKWADFMQASEEASTDGSGLRRRRRRMRAAEQAHADEHDEESGDDNAEGGGVISPPGRRRARTATCAIM